MNPDAPPPVVTLRHIARALNVSHATVSRALHDSPEISAARRKQIQDAARAMGYQRDPEAAALGQRRHDTAQTTTRGEIAWLNYWPRRDQLRSYREFELYHQAAADVARASGYRLEEYAGADRLSPARLHQILLTRNVRGILIPPQIQPLPSGFEAFDWSRFSIVRFGYSVNSPAAHVVTSSQLANASLAFAAMRARGYRRIGFVAGYGATNRFKAGFLSSQVDAPPEERVELLKLPGAKGGRLDRQVLCAWLEQHRPDAILTEIAEMKTLLADLGHEVPRDLGLATLSVLDGAADAGIYQNSEEIGRCAMETLIALIHHHHTGVPRICRETLIQGRWVDGATLPPRGAGLR